MNHFYIFFVVVSLILLSSCKKEESCTLKENDQAKIQNLYGTWDVDVSKEIWRKDTLHRTSGGSFSLELYEDQKGRMVSYSIDSFIPLVWVFQFDPDKIAIDLLGNISKGDFLFEIEKNSIESQKWVETKESTYPFGPNASDSRDVISIITWKLKK